MGLYSEPSKWTAMREAQQKQLYPELQVATPNEVLGVDAMRVQQGGAPSGFSSTVMRLAAAAAQRAAQKEQQA